MTIKDIAKVCGVSVSTVSRAFNDHPDINEETKQRIMETIKKYNYTPNNNARNLKIAESNTIAVLIKGITNAFFNEMIKIIEYETKIKKYSFLLHRVEEFEDEYEVAAMLEKEKRLNGVIFLGGNLGVKDHSEKLSIPYVLCTGSIFDEEVAKECSYVLVDDYLESYKMVDYLCKLGHKKIAIIIYPPGEYNVTRHRHSGYKKALEDNGLEYDESLVRYVLNDTIDTFTMQYGYEVTKELIKDEMDFSAIFATSDSIAVGAIKAISESGKKVPLDYSVAGFDGLDITYFYEPSITTIKQPAELMAAEAINILFDIMDGKIERKSHTFQGDLLIGGSTRKIK